MIFSTPNNPLGKVWVKYFRLVGCKSATLLMNRVSFLPKFFGSSPHGGSQLIASELFLTSAEFYVIVEPWALCSLFSEHCAAIGTEAEILHCSVPRRPLEIWNPCATAFEYPSQFKVPLWHPSHVSSVESRMAFFIYIIAKCYARGAHGRTGSYKTILETIFD